MLETEDLAERGRWHDALLNLSPRVEMEEFLRARAEKPILRMLELSR
jgi:quinolinate synthase